MGHLRSRLAQSQKMALSDPLTDLPNRRAFDISMKEAVETSRTKHQPLSVGFCDIDRFKLINDTHGHATGDRVIRYVADTLRKVVGPKVHVARHGGEEFALIFEHRDAEAAAELLDRARDMMSERNLLARDTQAEIGSVSFSGGIAELRSGENVTALLMRADNALYRAKETGRNRVLIAP
jgi:diguanylate cyclase